MTSIEALRCRISDWTWETRRLPSTSILADRRGMWAFVLGVILVTGGVLMHAPMFLMGRHNHFVLYGMPIGRDMIVGMAAIVGGCAIAAYGLLPRDIARQLAASQNIVVTPPEDAPLSAAHWGLMSVLVIALIIDIMKPATLGFTLPGMMSEYHVTKAAVSSFPFSALSGPSSARSSGACLRISMAARQRSCFRR